MSSVYLSNTPEGSAAALGKSIRWIFCNFITGPAWLPPTFALGTFALLVLQSEAMMEPRYREPVDSIPVCAALVMTHRKKAEQPLDIRTHG
jgi:hypothetical protein